MCDVKHNTTKNVQFIYISITMNGQPTNERSNGWNERVKRKPTSVLGKFIFRRKKMYFQPDDVNTLFRFIFV